MRNIGITDLPYGNLLDSDRQVRDRFLARNENR
jgi:hypothetical protein